MSDGVIVCVNWGEQTLPSERRVCPCGTVIALSSLNVRKVAEMELTPICLECTAPRLDVDTDVAGMVAGELHRNLRSAMLAAAALRNRN
jgi:hypothetical protein